MESIAAGNAGDVHYPRAGILRREKSPLQIEFLHGLQGQQIPNLAIFQALGGGSVDQIDRRDVLGAGDCDAGVAVSTSRKVGSPTAWKLAYCARAQGCKLEKAAALDGESHGFPILHNRPER